MPSGYPNGAAAPTDDLSEKATVVPQVADQAATNPGIILHFCYNKFLQKIQNQDFS
jgi:hypothetical protein